MIEVSIPSKDSTIRVSGDTAHQVVAQLAEVENSEISLAVGRLIRAAETQGALGKHLGATLLEEKPKAEAPAQPAAKGSFSSDRIPDGVKIVPGAPMVLGRPAWLINGTTKDGRPYQCFIHPDANVDRSLPNTDDENDPRLAAGAAKFLRYV